MASSGTPIRTHENSAVHLVTKKPVVPPCTPSTQWFESLVLSAMDTAIDTATDTAIDTAIDTAPLFRALVA